MEKCLYFCNWIVPATLPAEQRTRAGRFILFPMRYTKQPTSITDQINLLKLRGLIIDDETEAKAVLERISYFRLASYWRPMEQDKVLHIFKPNSHFSNVTTLYRFDSELKSIVFNSIQRIEIAVRTRMIQQFSMKYGSFWFMDKKLFASEEIFQKNLNSLRYAVERSNEDFVVEHFQRYDEPDMPPAWKSLELATLGTLSRMYSNFIDNGLKKQVARSFSIPQHEFMRNWLENLTIIRNVCAHHARLWNRSFAIQLRLPHHLHLPWISDFSFQEGRLYPLLCSIAYWLRAIDPQSTFVNDLKALFAKYPTVDLAAMRFPKEWQKEPLWK